MEINQLSDEVTELKTKQNELQTEYQMLKGKNEQWRDPLKVAP